MSLKRAAASEQKSTFQVTLGVICALGLLTMGLLIYQELGAPRPYATFQADYMAHLSQVGGHPQPAGIRQIEGPLGIDRCPTCHLGIQDHEQKGELAHPLKSHDPAIFKHHPPRIFGCTSCHGGSGSYVDRCLPAQGQARGKREIQASCRWCHREAENLAGAEKLTAGLRAYRRLGCGGCHRSDIDPGPRIGPPLDNASCKLNTDFLRAFIADPQDQRPGTAMPSFFSDGLLEHAPGFTRRAMLQERGKKIDALVSFLWHLAPDRACPQLSFDRARPLNPIPGKPAIGKQLFGALGCQVCHLDTARTKTHDPRIGAVGPDLSRAGQRLAPAWIARWLDAPRRLFPDTKMPAFRLQQPERSHLTAYLHSLGGPDQTSKTERPPSPALRGTGRQLAQELGCAGCHDIAPFKNMSPVGPELDGFGDKSSAWLDWGGWSDATTPRTPWTWTRLKLTQPLIFDRRPGVLIMPWQAYREGELAGLQLLMSSLTASPPPAGLTAQPKEQGLRLSRGEKIITRLNCRQCHKIDGRGGNIRALIPRPSERPPSLTKQGAKVLPSWVFSYLARPTGLRPWLALRMPTFKLSHRERQHLAATFAAQDRAPYPFTPRQLAPLPPQRLEQALTLFNRLQCLRCHQLSNAASLKPGELSPDLALAHDRLQRSWIRRFILSPQQVMPGTTMPTLFMLEDEDDPTSRITPYPQYFSGDIQQQVEALADLSLWWGTAAAARRLSSQTTQVE